jgi:hypothetical protein
MSEVFKGWVKKLNSKDGQAKSGRPYTLWSAKLEKEDGTEYDNWISFGFTKPEIKEGDYVKITAEQDGKYLQVKEVKRLKNAPARVVAKGAEGTNQNVSTSTQVSIHYQSARKDALQAIDILIKSDALPISAAKTKAGEAKRYVELLALIDKLTVQFFYDAQTHRLLATVADAGAIAPDAAGSLPEDSDGDDEEESVDEDDDEEEESDDE